MGIFSSLSKIGSAVKTKFGEEDFRDKLSGIGSALQGDKNAYENFTKRKASRHAADDVANAMTNSQMPEMPDPNAPPSDLGQVQMPKMMNRLQGRSPLPMLPAKGLPTFGRRF